MHVFLKDTYFGGKFVQGLVTLAHRCLAYDPNLRPAFKEVTACLATLFEVSSWQSLVSWKVRISGLCESITRACCTGSSPQLPQVSKVLFNLVHNYAQDGRSSGPYNWLLSQAQTSLSTTWLSLLWDNGALVVPSHF